MSAHCRSRRPSTLSGDLPVACLTCFSISSTNVRTWRALRHEVITNASVTPSSSRMSRTTVSWPSLSSAARAADRAPDGISARVPSARARSGDAVIRSSPPEAAQPFLGGKRPTPGRTPRSARRPPPTGGLPRRRGPRPPTHALHARCAAVAPGCQRGQPRANDVWEPGRSSGPSVQTEPPNATDGSLGNEEIHWAALGQTTAEITARDLEGGDDQPLHAPAGRVGYRRHPAPVHHDQHHLVREVLRPVPGGEIADEVRPDDEVELRSGVLPAELVHGVDRVARAATVDLDPARLHPLDTIHRGRNDGEAVLGSGDGALPHLLPGLVGHHQEHLIEVQFVACLDGGEEMPDVHGIEGAAEDTDALRVGHFLRCPILRCPPAWPPRERTPRCHPRGRPSS